MPEVPTPQIARSTSRTPQIDSGAPQPTYWDARPGHIQEMGAALSKTGAELAGMAVQMNEDHAAATSMSVLNGWSEEADGVFQEFQSKLGRDAVDVDGKAGDSSKRVGDQIQRSVEAHEKRLGSDLARRLFRDRASRAMVAYRGQLAQHELNQTRAMRLGEHTASMGLWAGKFANGDKSAWGKAIDYAGEIASDKGMGKKAREAFMLNVKTTMHTGRLSKFFAEKDTVGADEYLKSIDRGEIDPTQRTKLREKIDRVMGAEANIKAAIDLVRDGGRTPGERVSPAAQAKDLQAWVEQAMGPTEPDWRAALSDPQVIASVPDDKKTLDDEIAGERHPGQRRASNGVNWQRCLDTLDQRLRDKKITAIQYLAQQQVVSAQFRLRIAVQAEAAEGALREYEEAISGMRPGTNASSPAFQSEHTDLYQRMVDLRVLSQANGISAKRTESAYLHMLHARIADESLGDMTSADFFTTFYGKLDLVQYEKGRRVWKSLQKGADPIAATLVDNEVADFLSQADYFTGDVDPRTGFRMPGNSEELRNSMRVDRALNERRMAGKGFKTREELHQWIQGVVFGQKVLVAGEEGGFFGVTLWRDPAEKVSPFSLKNERQEAEIRYRNNPTKANENALALAEKRDQNVTKQVTVDGNVKKWIRSDSGRTESGVSLGSLVTGIVENPERPDKVTWLDQHEVYRVLDAYRLDRLEARVDSGDMTVDEFNEFSNRLTGFGAVGPGRMVKPRDRRDIEIMFLKEGVKMPGLGEQVALLEEHWRDDAEKRSGKPSGKYPELKGGTLGRSPAAGWPTPAAEDTPLLPIYELIELDKKRRRAIKEDESRQSALSRRKLYREYIELEKKIQQAIKEDEEEHRESRERQKQKGIRESASKRGAQDDEREKKKQRDARESASKRDAQFAEREKNKQRVLAGLAFDPDGSGYDEAGARSAGLKPDKSGHWPSRDPKTGMLFKGKGHKTWAKTVKGEEDAGFEVYRDENTGRYFSFKVGQSQPARYRPIRRRVPGKLLRRSKGK